MASPPVKQFPLPRLTNLLGKRLEELQINCDLNFLDGGTFALVEREDSARTIGYKTAAT